MTTLTAETLMTRDELSAKVEAIYHDRIEVAAEQCRFLTGMRRDWMEENGVCVSCDGKGFHEHRWHDGDTQFDPCADCSGRGYFGAEKPVVPEFVHPDAEMTKARVNAARRVLESVSGSVTAIRGKRVQIVAGRKFRGEIVTVAWAGETRYGFRIGFDRNGVREWIAFTNVEQVFTQTEADAILAGIE